VSNNKSYIADHHKMTSAQADYLNEILDELDCFPADRRLFGHIVSCAQLQKHNESKIPVPWETIQRDIPGAKAFRLRPLLRISGFSRGSCRTYEPADWVMDRLLEISASTTPAQIIQNGFVDFDTGRKMNKRPASRLNDANRNPEPPMIRACIKKLTENGAYIMLDDFETKFQDLVKAFRAMGDGAPRRERYRLINNTSCREKTLGYGLEPVGGGVYRYTPALHPVSTGRLHIDGGCLQSTSRDLKSAAYARMPGFRNFDVKSCQPSICIRYMQRAGIDATPLIDYLETTDYKKVFGDAIGVSGSLVKRIVISICMGAWLPKKANNAHQRDNSILQYLIEELEDDEDKLKQVLKKLWDVLGGIANCLKEWHSYLLEKYIDAHKVSGGNGYWLTNESGKRLSLKDLRLKSQRFRWIDVSKCAAHLLQGMEAAVIQEFIVKDEGIRVIQVEHDGFIINSGSPDMHLWDAITGAHGLGGLALEEKPL
jgi:hypothetical protein